MEKLFKEFMRVNSRLAKEFNFKASMEDILEAKEEFNTGDKGRVLISKMIKYDMEVILKLPGIEEDIEEIDPYIGPFMEMINSKIAEGRNPGEEEMNIPSGWHLIFHTSSFMIDLVNEFIPLDDYPKAMRKETQTEKEQKAISMTSDKYVSIVIEQMNRLEGAGKIKIGKVP